MPVAVRCLLPDTTVNSWHRQPRYDEIPSAGSCLDGGPERVRLDNLIPTPKPIYHCRIVVGSINMASIESWKKRIVEKFIERSHPTFYYITNPQEILDSFGSIEYNGNQAWDQLREDEILVSSVIDNRTVIHLNLNKELEIRNLYNTEPVEEVMAKLQPPPSTFDGLDIRHSFVTENAWPNQGTYYLCTKVGDPTYWVAIYRSKPNKKPTTMRFGSLRDDDSKIVSMWNTICDVARQEPKLWRKRAEDENQWAFGNNRQPGTATFNIFCYLGLLSEVERKGKRVFYSLDDVRLYDELRANHAHMCRGCARICRDRYCDHCKAPI